MRSFLQRKSSSGPKVRSVPRGSLDQWSAEQSDTLSLRPTGMWSVSPASWLMYVNSSISCMGTQDDVLIQMLKLNFRRKFSYTIETKGQSFELSRKREFDSALNWIPWTIFPKCTKFTFERHNVAMESHCSLSQRAEICWDTYRFVMFWKRVVAVQDVVNPTAHPRLLRQGVNQRDAHRWHGRRDVLPPQRLRLQRSRKSRESVNEVYPNCLVKHVSSAFRKCVVGEPL